MIRLEYIFWLAGAFFAAVAFLSACDASNPKRWGNAAFWGLMAISLISGTGIAKLPYGNFLNGLIVLGLAGLAGFGALGKGNPPTISEPEREAWSARLGNKLFLPALLIPIVAIPGTLLYTYYPPFAQSGVFEAKRETFILLGLGVVIALGVIMAWLRPPAVAPLQEGRRLLDSIGWAAVLPQMLAALGAVFAAAHVGDIIGGGAQAMIPGNSIFLTVLVYAAGMALFTIIMGNAFAAFPVMAGAIGVPLLINGYGGDAAVIGAVGMLSGFCGTLMTPMAANFNLVPAALLELKDRNGVIKAQVATALPLFAVNVAILYFFGFR